MRLLRTMLGATAALLVLGGTPVAAENERPSGTISIDETQFGFLLGGSTGGGTLRFHDKHYGFKIGGISVGDIGVSHVRGRGEVYGLTNVADFAGTYSKLDASATLGKGKGVLRLKNEHGVTLEISTTSGGLQLSAGAGGVQITMR